MKIRECNYTVLLILTHTVYAIIYKTDIPELLI